MTELKPRTRKRKPRTTCKKCKRPLPAIAILHDDPYCSTKCARIAYGVVEREKLT